MKALVVFDGPDGFDVARDLDKPVTVADADAGVLGRAFPSGRWEHIRDLTRDEQIRVRILACERGRQEIEA